ncbi:CNGC5-like protein, partial [Trifolium pratense]
MERVRVNLKFQSCLTVDVVGHSGGLSVMWKDTIRCRVMNYSRHFINLIVSEKEEEEWRLTCYYGYPERGRRRQAWDLLRELRDMSNLPWCIIDIQLEGYPYTWVKSRGATNAIEERLDRAMANSIWLTTYPSVKLEDDIDEVVEDGWGRESGADVISKTTRCAEKLKGWGRRKHMRFKQEVLECSEEMERLRGCNDSQNSGRFKEIQEKHARLLVQEESYWKQRAKMHWLKEGDLNTKFFHMSASARQRVKKISKLVNDENIVITSQPELCTVALNYFDQLFKSNPSSHDPILSLIAPKITQDDNDQLVRPITREELKEALFQMHPDKAPGPDGFNPAFYQHFWDLCGNDVFEAATEWLERGYFPSSLNETNICLIPKCENPTSMKDLRPISLCNVLYKMISKLLANRLKSCLEKCVSEEQSAFIEGRSILDNALIAVEVIHALKRRTRGWKGELALKIDISKAYDKVDWG